MKKYIFFTRTICGIGGAEQYTYNKARYAAEQGYDVYIFSGQKGEIMISEFRKHEQYIIPGLAYCPALFSKKEVQRILEDVVRMTGCDQSEECIIQSDAATRAVWAELLARRVKGTHLAFILQEQHNYSDEMRRFLRFKLMRKELAGITKHSVSQMLNDPGIEYAPHMSISAFCNNVTADCEDTISSLLDQSADYTIGSIGRLEKLCVLPIVNAVCEYAGRYPGQKCNLILIGGTEDQAQLSRIQEAASRAANVKLVITGLLYPIPESLLRNIDAFVSTAGSVRVSYNAERPTVMVHPDSGVPVGILGYDYQLGERTMYDAEQGADIASKLELILHGGIDIVYSDESTAAYQERMSKEFARQLSFARQGGEKEYYGTGELLALNVVMSSKTREMLYKIVGKVFGSAAIDFLKQRVKRR